MKPMQTLAWAVAIGSLSCSPEPAGPDVGPRHEPPLPPLLGTLTLSPAPSLVLLGNRLVLGATLIGVDGSYIMNQPVTWSTSDSTVAPLLWSDAQRVEVGMRALGSATITAHAQGMTASTTLTPVPEPPPSSAVRVEGLSLLEFVDGFGYYEDWSYAPQGRVLESTGTGTATLLGIRFTIPGSSTTSLCTTTRAIPAGAAVDLFQESYGRWEVYYYGAARATMREAMAWVYFRDAEGQLGSSAVIVPVRAGDPPGTYSERRVPNPWRC